jgi:hypothetical protein
MPGFDYFTISRLREQELFDYVSGLKKKDLEAKLKKGFFRRMLRYLDVFFALLLSVLAIGGVSFYFGDYVLGLFFVVFFCFSLVFYIFVLKKLFRFRSSFSNLTEPVFKVIKDGKILFVPRSKISVGDIILIEEGMKVPFDVRLLESRNLVVDETLVFGEGDKVNKHAGTLSGKEFKLYELGNIVFKNSVVVRGSGKGIVFNVPRETEGLSRVEGILLRGKKKIFYILIWLFFSLIFSLIVFFISKKIVLALGVFFVSLILSSPSVMGKLVLLKTFEFMNYLVSKGVVIGSPFLLFRLSKVSRVFVNLKQSSFESTKVKIFIPKESVYLSFENFNDLGGIPYEYLVYTYFLISVIHAKQRGLGNKVYLMSCINFLKSLIPDEYLNKVFSIVDYGIFENPLESRSFVEVGYEGRKFRLESIPLRGYFDEFGDIPGLRYDSEEGIVILKVEGNEIDLISVVLFEGMKMDFGNLMKKLEVFAKVYFTSSLSRKELKRFFDLIYVDFESLASVDVKEMEGLTPDEMRFYLEKFSFFCKVSDDFLTKFFPLFVRKEHDTSVFAFYDSPYGRIEISALPNVSKSMNSTVFTVGENLFLPLLTIEFSREVTDSLKRLSRVLIVVSYLFSLLIFGSLLISVILAFVFVLLLGFVCFWFLFKSLEFE